ncbi:MAG: cupin domain-containing protein [Acidobacteriota bacterium]|nr:cupin domain-containing protein [Acidobacteriota bacterium]MDH3784101.1 cupin domain-containing protein [Acidobacteriota bacterium]
MTERSADKRDGAPQAPALEGNHSKVIRFDGQFGWEGVDLEDYKSTTESWRGVTRTELAGKRGESPRFHVRYFEIAPGGFSTLEKHQHEHVVIPQRGVGEIQFGCYQYRVGFGDVVYVAPEDPHQFRCPEDADEPFGFLCIVNAERDRPQAVDGMGACHICE